MLVYDKTRKLAITLVPLLKSRLHSKFLFAEVVVFTVATNETEGFRRYVRSAEVFGLDKNLQILGKGEPWRGGDVKRWAGGGQKVNLLKKAVDKLKGDDAKIVLFTDSYDVVFLASLQDIVKKFNEWKDARVVFSAEEYCWPDKSLAAKYPEVHRGKRFLNSGGFIGYLDDVREMLRYDDIEDGDDDQLFYTKIYLDSDFREKHQIKLDHKSEIFQNLNGATCELF